jgi:hypothetical protein
VTKRAPSLKTLAAKVIGNCLKSSGVEGGMQSLKLLPYPGPLIKLVQPWLTLSKDEWIFYMNEEIKWQTTNPDCIRLKRITRHYLQLYPGVAEAETKYLLGE